MNCFFFSFLTRYWKNTFSSCRNSSSSCSGGAAGGGNLVVSESQAYGLLITGTVLASWDTHAGKVSGSKRSEVLQSFEAYYNFWKQMCKDSSSNEETNCQPDGKYCTDTTTGTSSVCLPDWRHYKTGGSEATGPAPVSTYRVCTVSIISCFHTFFQK